MKYVTAVFLFLAMSASGFAATNDSWGPGSVMDSLVQRYASSPDRADFNTLLKIQRSCQIVASVESDFRTALRAWPARCAKAVIAKLDSSVGPLDRASSRLEVQVRAASTPATATLAQINALSNACWQRHLALTKFTAPTDVSRLMPRGCPSESAVFAPASDAANGSESLLDDGAYANYCAVVHNHGYGCPGNL